jgi:hypothetical protein
VLASPPPPDTPPPPSPDEEQALAGLRRRRLTTILVGGVAVTCLLVPLVGVLLSPAILSARQRDQRLRCAERLARLGLAARAYADDHGAFPHVGPADALDSGPGSDHTSRSMRALVWHGYTDRVDDFVCPASPELASPVADEAREDMRRWFWGGRAEADPGRSPFVDDLLDPPLDLSTELSYGWTRRSLPASSQLELLAADRGVAVVKPDEVKDGNHTDGWNTLRADGRVEWLGVDEDPFPGAYLPATEGGLLDGYLSVIPQPDPAPFR